MCCRFHAVFQRQNFHRHNRSIQGKQKNANEREGMPHPGDQDDPQQNQLGPCPCYMINQLSPHDPKAIPVGPNDGQAGPDERTMCRPQTA